MDKLLTMKNTITAILLFASFSMQAQDTTKVKGLQLRANLIEYLIVNAMNPNNDSLYQVYIDLRPKFRINNPPNGNTFVTIDSIPTIELANLYNYTLANSEGIGMGNNMKTQIASARLSNSYLERLCAAFENTWADRLLSIRISGRKLLRGKQ